MSPNSTTNTNRFWMSQIDDKSNRRRRRRDEGERRSLWPLLLILLLLLLLAGGAIGYVLTRDDDDEDPQQAAPTPREEQERQEPEPPPVFIKNEDDDESGSWSAKLPVSLPRLPFLPDIDGPAQMVDLSGIGCDSDSKLVLQGDHATIVDADEEYIQNAFAERGIDLTMISPDNAGR